MATQSPGHLLGHCGRSFSREHGHAGRRPRPSDQPRSMRAIFGANRKSALNRGLRTEQEELEIRRRNEMVGGRGDPALARGHQVRGDHDHQLGLGSLEAGRAEQGPQDRQVAQEGKLVDGVLVVVLASSPAITAKDLRRRAARRWCGPGGPSGPGTLTIPRVDRSGGLSMAETSGLTTDVDQPVLEQDGRRERQGHAELLEFFSTVMVANAAAGCGRPRTTSAIGIGEFAAGQEVGGIARHGHQVRLGQRLDEALGLESALNEQGQISVAAAERGDAGCRSRRRPPRWRWPLAPLDRNRRVDDLAKPMPLAGRFGVI